MFYLTTSWDDGDALDMKLASLLDRHEVKGTFYISKNCCANRLSEKEIAIISSRHEIGAHTISHPDLRLLSRNEKKQEIIGSKEWLEQIIGKRAKAFCYPYGYYDGETVEVVKEAGFDIARTTNLDRIGAETNLWEMPVTLHAYPFPLRKVDSKSYYWGDIFSPLKNYSGALRSFGVSFYSMSSWGRVSRRLVDLASETGDIIHLWGHSREIEKYDMWEEVEKFFKYCKNLPECKVITNGEIKNIIHENSFSQ